MLATKQRVDKHFIIVIIIIIDRLERVCDVDSHVTSTSILPF